MYLISFLVLGSFSVVLSMEKPLKRTKVVLSQNQFDGINFLVKGSELEKAINNGFVSEALQLIAQYPALVNDKYLRTGRTPLIEAIRTVQDVLVRTMLIAGANVDATDDNKNTPLMYAGTYDLNGSIITMLLDYGANRLAKNKRNLCAFDYAVTANNIMAVKILAEYKKTKLV
jgi:ankyrin repeat protein